MGVERAHGHGHPGRQAHGGGHVGRAQTDAFDVLAAIGLQLQAGLGLDQLEVEGAAGAAQQAALGQDAEAQVA